MRKKVVTTMLYGLTTMGTTIPKLSHAQNVGKIDTKVDRRDVG